MMFAKNSASISLKLCQFTTGFPKMQQTVIVEYDFGWSEACQLVAGRCWSKMYDTVVQLTRQGRIRFIIRKPRLAHTFYKPRIWIISCFPKPKCLHSLEGEVHRFFFLPAIELVLLVFYLLSAFSDFLNYSRPTGYHILRIYYFKGTD